MSWPAVGMCAVGTRRAAVARALLPARCRCLDRPQTSGWALCLRLGIRFPSPRLGLGTISGFAGTGAVSALSSCAGVEGFSGPPSPSPCASCCPVGAVL